MFVITGIPPNWAHLVAGRCAMCQTVKLRGYPMQRATMGAAQTAASETPRVARSTKWAREPLSVSAMWQANHLLVTRGPLTRH